MTVPERKTLFYQPDEVPFYRSDLYWTAFYTFVLGLVLGLTLARSWKFPWTALRVGGLLALLVFTVRRAAAGLVMEPGAGKRYRINPDDVAHFRARQAERKGAIGHE